MSGLLPLHSLAATRGDGLHPQFRALLEERALRAADPRLAELDAVRGTSFVQAGPCPAPAQPDFLPGNVVPFAAAGKLASSRKSARAS